MTATWRIRTGRATLFCVALIVLTLASCTASAQKKRHTSTSVKPFFVPCSKALRIGLEKVTDLYDEDQIGRNKGQTDSGTEGAAYQAAQRNYISCRQKNNALRLKKLAPHEQKAINDDAQKMLMLARAHVDLIPSISFDEKAEDPINYGITHTAIALVEDYKGAIISLARENRDPNFVQELNAAGRNEKRIAELLSKIESRANEEGDEMEFAAFKARLNQSLAESKDSSGAERYALTNFLVRLLKIGLPDEK